MVFIGLQIKWTMLIMKRSNVERYDTTIEEQFSYISITLREAVKIVFHRVFPQKCINLWKLRKKIKD